MKIIDIIANDAQAREGTSGLSKLDEALSSEVNLDALISGLPARVAESLQQAFLRERDELKEQLDRYLRAKAGDTDDLLNHTAHDLGTALIGARIDRGLSQKQLARMLGMKEQQIQRYEADKYRKISIPNYQKIAFALGFDILLKRNNWRGPHSLALLVDKADPGDVRKVLRHAKENGWFEKSPPSDDDAVSQLKRIVADHVTQHGTPSLLRTGLNVLDHNCDWKLLAWKARVSIRAEAAKQNIVQQFNPLDVCWLLDLAKMSRLEEGPSLVANFLLDKGIIFIVEPHITGITLDGAAWLIDGVPVVGVTIRKDNIDNFWYTLFHELGHVFLHIRRGLLAGFFDEFTKKAPEDLDAIEKEANDFATEILIPTEKWKKSPARIAKTSAPIEKLAEKLGIHPAIVFGRIRYERDDYSLFAKKIGSGTVRKQLAVST